MTSGCELLSSESGVAIAGELDAGNLPALSVEVHALEVAGDSFELDLSELDLLDGTAILGMVDIVRFLGERTIMLTIHGAPQLLAHTLYRADRLDNVHLSAPREEEPYG